MRGYRRRARRYERLHGEIFSGTEQERLRKALRQALESVEEPPPESKLKVLDFGCGSGNATRHLVGLDAEVLAADVSPAFLEMIDRQFGDDDVRTVAINGLDLGPLGDSSVDMAVAYSVLHHVPDYLAALEELCRVVRPGGVLLIDHEAGPAEWNGDPELTTFRTEVLAHQRGRSKPLRRFLQVAHYRALGSHYLLLARRRLGNPRYWPEGDIHVWPDDHIDWDAVEKVLDRNGYEVVVRDDYLLYRQGTPEPLYQEFRHRTADVRMIMARRTS